YSNSKTKHKDTVQTVNFELPLVNSLLNGRNYHLYISAENELKLNDLLKEYFYLDFDRYYLQGKKRGHQQKDIINSFILSRRLAQIDTAHETIKKRQYREQVAMINHHHKKLVNRAYHRNEKVKFHEESIIKYQEPLLQ
ncbi:MAG: hypothetical protein JXR07_20310, partial [Reichenbachiella sp.]